MPLQSEKYPGLPLRAPEMYELLGLDPKKHLPDDGIMPQTIQGYRIYVLSKSGLKIINSVRGRRGPRATKRVYVVCNSCGRPVEFGHLHQHEVIHNE